ncbi:hypothetical protein [Peribacillus simplex]|uniref:hypothetical protein n=1 Tax=Peribacillus simplex TaxID=1478 RepID=UPI003D2A4527
MKWTPEKVHQEIKLFYEKGEELTPKNVRKKYGGLYYAAIKYCGSWKNAVNEAGFIYDNFVVQQRTAESVLEEIKKLYQKGEDLSTKNVRNKWKSLHDAAYRHFGSWQNACEVIGIQVKAKIRWSKEKVLEEINSFHEKGESLHSRNTQRKYNALLKAAKRYYGSWESAVSLAGFNYEEIMKIGREEGSKLISKAAQSRYNNEYFIAEQREIIVKEIQTLYKENNMLSYGDIRKDNSGLISRMGKYFDSMATAMNEAGINYDEIKKQKAIRKWNTETIKSEILRIKENGEPLNASYIIKNHRQLYRAIVSHLDSWENALSLVGIDYQKIKSEVIERVKEKSTLYTKEFVISELNNMKRNGLILSQKHVKEYNSALVDACYNRFGSLQNAIEEAGFDYDEELALAREEWLKSQMKVQLKWTEEKIIDEILKLDRNDIPLSTSYIKNNYRSLYDGANNWIGSWGAAVTAAGLNYDEIREDRYKASYCGQLFEKLVDELLIDIGVVYEKYEHERWNPDYILHNNVWMDAKLSQWTVFESKTIERYKEHCRMLTIVYMRGRRGEISDIIIDKNVRLISVYKFIKQLPKYKQKKYHEAISEIKTILHEFEIWGNEKN